VKLHLGRYEERVRARVEALRSAGAPGRIFEHDATFWGGDDARRGSVASRLGWLTVADEMRAHVDELRAFADEVRAAGYRDAVLLGMGGSSLAPEVLRQSVAVPRSHVERPAGLRLHVLDTTDPATIRAVADAIDITRTLFFVSSKSGTTIEPLCLFAYFHGLAEAVRPGRAGEQFVAITDPGTPLQRLAEEHRFRRVFTNPQDIGGRYSALSYFGLAPAVVAGVDIDTLLERGSAMAEASRRPQGEALTLGAVLGELALAGRDKCTFVVSPSIASFGLWVEQLIAESTGKDGKGILPVAGEPLATPLQYGDDRLFVQVRLEADDNGEEDAAIGALIAEGFPAVIIELTEDEYDLGGEFFRWEFAVAVAGQVLGINPFDEPNVQESKDNTHRVLAELERTGELDVHDIDGHPTPVVLTTAGRQASGDLGCVLRELLTGVAPPQYVAFTAYVRETDATDAAFDGMRQALVEGPHVATTLGYGPRFLHSTGQLHKGGPRTGVFVQVTQTDADDIAIPGRPFTFGQLKRAQAIGDFEALAAHGLPAVRVHVGDDVERGLRALRGALLEATATGAREG